LASVAESAKEISKSKIRQLREAAHPPGSKGLWLKNLNDRQLAEVYHRLRLGQPLSKIARIVQVEWGVRPNSDTRSVSKGLGVFKDRVLGELEKFATKERKTESEKSDEKIISDQGKRIKKDLDALGSYRWLIDVQMDRLEMIRQQEKNLEMPIATFDKASKELRESMNSYVAILMKLGILDSVPDTSTLEVKTAFDEMISDMSEQGGNSMISALGKFLRTADSHTLPLIKQNDGSYSTKKD